MALRVRKDGKILCAAMHKEKEGDLYIDDSLHYLLSVEMKLIVTEPHEKHSINGEWWFANQVPKDIEIDSFYE